MNRTSYKIPKIIHYTFRNNNFPENIKQNILHNKIICNDCEFRFYNDADIKKFIKTHFPENINRAFNSINDCYGAMKADFFRYCVLYICGGVYIDIKSRINKRIFDIIQPNDTCILDLPRTIESWRKYSPTYEQWLLMFAPLHPYLKTVIHTITYNINRRYIPRLINRSNKVMNISNSSDELPTKTKILLLTGPDAFSKAIHNFIRKNKKILHRNIDYNLYFNWSIPNYKNIYRINNMSHYSELKLPLYK